MDTRPGHLICMEDIKLQLLPTSEVAKRLGKTQRTIIRMCQAGKLRSRWGVSNGKPGYLVEWDEDGTTLNDDHGERSHSLYYDDWLRNIDLTLATTSVKTYVPLVKKYFEKYSMLSTKFIQFELSQKSSWATRQTFHGAIGNYARFLQDNGVHVEPIPRCSLKPEKPIRQTVLTVEQLNAVFQSIEDSKFYTDHEKKLNAALIAFMAYTGARVSETASFTTERLQLCSQEVTLLRKGGSWQGIGFPPKLLPFLEAYIPYRRPAPGHDTFFLNLVGKPLCRKLIGSRIKRVSLNVGIDFTAHGLRRTFATVNSQMGRSIEVISKALNHSKLVTTQKYLKTTEKQVKSHMKDWDY